MKKENVFKTENEIYGRYFSLCQVLTETTEKDTYTCFYEESPKDSPRPQRLQSPPIEAIGHQKYIVIFSILTLQLFSIYVSNQLT